MDALEPQVVRERGDMTGMVGNRQMTGRHAAAVTCPPDADHPEPVERARLTHGQEPVAEDPRVDEEHRLTLATVGIGNVRVVDREAFHASDSKPDVRARGAVSAFPSR